MRSCTDHALASGRSRLALVFCLAGLQAACSDGGDSSPAPEPVVIGGSVNGSAIDFLTAAPAAPGSNDVAAVQDDAPATSEPQGVLTSEGGRADPDGDDRPGLIVEGLNGRSANDVLSPWLANVRLYRLDASEPVFGDSTVVDFNRYASPISLAVHANFYGKALDTCEFQPQVVTFAGDERERDCGCGNGRLPNLVSGGEQAVIRSPAGVDLTIGRTTMTQEGVTENYYRDISPMPGPFLDGSTLSAPGDEFPAITAFPLPSEPAVPVRLLPADEEVLGEDTVYSWMPGREGDHMLLEFIEPDAAPIDGARTRLVCRVTDDGRFVPPDDARAFIAGSNGSLKVRYSRARDVLTVRDDIAIRVRLSVGE